MVAGPINQQRIPIMTQKVQAFYVRDKDLREFDLVTDGWYYWRHFPDCPDPVGPFETKAEALAAAQEDAA
jgi:hypothetical protein